MNDARSIDVDSSVIAEIVRILMLQLLLLPAAAILPRRWALKLAGVLSVFLLILPTPGLRSYWEVRSAFGMDRIASLRITRRRLLQALHGFVMHKRVIFGREDSSKWVVKQKNRENVETLLESGASFIIATAHFQRFAFLATALVDVTPGNLVQVALPAPDRIKSIKDARNRLAKSTLTRFLYDIRVGLQYRAMNEALVIARNEDVEFAWVLPDASAAQRLYKKLVEKGNIINVHVDAPWTENSNGTYSRSFAGVQRRPFATGAAQLSKLAQCPIISCVYWMNADGSIVLEWGSPIRDVDNEKEIMDRLINTFETAIGERPTQYSLNMGSERCWSPALHIWQD